MNIRMLVFPGGVDEFFFCIHTVKKELRARNTNILFLLEDVSKTVQPTFYVLRIC